MLEKCKKFIKTYKKTVISNEDERFKRALAEVIEEIVEGLENIAEL